jgi:hypothetical protein
MHERTKRSYLKTVRFLNKAILILWELCLKAYFYGLFGFGSFFLSLFTTRFVRSFVPPETSGRTGEVGVCEESDQNLK